MLAPPPQNIVALPGDEASESLKNLAVSGRDSDFASSEVKKTIKVPVKKIPVKKEKIRLISKHHSALEKNFVLSAITKNLSDFEICFIAYKEPEMSVLFEFSLKAGTDVMNEKVIGAKHINNWSCLKERLKNIQFNTSGVPLNDIENIQIELNL